MKFALDEKAPSGVLSGGMDRLRMIQGVVGELVLSPKVQILGDTISNSGSSNSSSSRDFIGSRGRMKKKINAPRTGKHKITNAQKIRGIILLMTRCNV